MFEYVHKTYSFPMRECLYIRQCFSYELGFTCEKRLPMTQRFTKFKRKMIWLGLAETS